jgi:hypothetical protein
MKLPADYLELVHTGAAALRDLAAQLRGRAAARPDVPELWLSVRDYEGLADRLACPGAREWQVGVTLLIAGQDFGVLDELIAGCDNAPILPSDSQRTALARLRQYLRQYFDRELWIDEPPG